MFVRYKTDGRGKSTPVAKIYTQKEHPIRNSMIDKDALWAIRKLQGSGAEAYIVGGSIRDLLLGRKPKDFDIATSASPRQVQRLFWNSRIIGKRFRIVHLFFGEKVIEVTTFRSDEENFEEGNNNIYGTIEQDARRRDFSINAMYYNPSNEQLLDFCSGYDDFKKRIIRSLIPLQYSFSEDPVRMLRAIKYQVTTGFNLKWNVKRAIKKNASNITTCSNSRLTEEIYKILSCGCSEPIFVQLKKYDLLPYLMPCYSVYISIPAITASLKRLDQRVNEAMKNDEKLSRSEILYYLIRPAIVVDNSDNMTTDELFKDIFRQSKVLVSPTTPANFELEKAVNMIMDDLGIARKSKKKRQPSAKKAVPVRKVAPDADTSRRKKRNKKKQSVNYTTQPDEPKTLAESHDM